MNYKVRNWEAAQRARDKVVGGYGDRKEEHSLYEELLGRYLEFPDTNDRNTQEILWKSCNDIIDEFMTKGHPEYSRFKIEPLWEDRVGFKPHYYIHLLTAKAQVHAALKRIANDYGFLDPTHQISEYKKEHGMQINNTNNNNQTQTNAQTTSIGINVQQLEEALSESLSESQLAEIKPKIDKFASEPKKWVNAESLIKGALGFGKEAALVVLKTVVDKYMP